MQTKQCSACANPFYCQITVPQKKCWCVNYPLVLPLDTQQDCLCPRCLAKQIAEHIQIEINLKSTKEMLQVAKPYRQSNELIEQLDYTIEGGNYVFTKWFHLKRGKCCKNGCRNCPYSSPK